MHIRYKMHTLAAQWHIGEAVRAAQSAKIGALLITQKYTDMDAYIDIINAYVGSSGCHQRHIGEAVRAAQSAEFGALLRREINHYEATDTCVAGERI